MYNCHFSRTIIRLIHVVAVSWSFESKAISYSAWLILLFKINSIYIPLQTTKHYPRSLEVGFYL